MPSPGPDAVKRLPDRSKSAALAEASAALGIVLLFVNLFSSHGAIAAFGIGLLILAVYLKLPTPVTHHQIDLPAKKPSRPI